MSLLAVYEQFGCYQIIRHIASGGMAQIYLAKVRGLHGFEKYLALKVINPELATEERFIQMLIDEAKITVGLSHVNIGQIFDLGHVNDIYYIAMEYVDGVDILELVNGLHALGEKVPIPAVVLIGRQICSGLHFAHTRKDKQGNPLNIVHRDISPQNILVSKAGEVKVVDFGIAKAAGLTAKTQAGVIKGKVHYMSPEQALGKKVDCRADIFSTGIVLWEMLTSQMVYSGENVQELLERVRAAEIPPPSKMRPEIPEMLDHIVLKALASEIEDRFQSAHDLQVELTRFLSGIAPNYNNSNLAELIEKVISSREPDVSELEIKLSQSDLIQEIHSVIAEHSSVIKSIDRARLLVETPQDKTIRFIDDELVIGRAGQLVLPDSRVSRRHARIFRQVEKFILEDLGSANGTFLNDQKLAHSQVLKDQDRIRIGACRLLFLTEESADKQHILSAQPEPLTKGKLLITADNTSSEHFIDRQLNLTYQVRIGEAQFVGTVGRITHRDNAFWLEPETSRGKVIYNGEALESTQRLNDKDTFNVGSVTFEFRLSE